MEVTLTAAAETGPDPTKRNQKPLFPRSRVMRTAARWDIPYDHLTALVKRGKVRLGDVLLLERLSAYYRAGKRAHRILTMADVLAWLEVQ